LSLCYICILIYINFIIFCAFLAKLFCIYQTKDVTQGKITARLVQKIFDSSPTVKIRNFLFDAIASAQLHFLRRKQERHCLPAGWQVCSSQDHLTESNPEVSKTSLLHNVLLDDKLLGCIFLQCRKLRLWPILADRGRICQIEEEFVLNNHRGSMFVAVPHQ